MNNIPDPLYNLIPTTPNRIVEPYSWIEHTPFAFYLIKTIDPRLFVELGVHSGNSYNAFCQQVKTQGTKTECFGIDTWRGDEHAGFYDESIYADLLKYQQENFPFSRLLRMTFDEGANYFSEKTIDLLHIDGHHTYESVKHDFENWLPKMSERGVVVLHDIAVRERGFGVWKFWEELKAAYPSFEFAHGHGLGTVAVGSNVPELLRGLCGGAGQDVRFISDLFYALGSRISLQQTASKQSEHLHEQALQIVEGERKLAEVKSALADRDLQMAARDQQIARLTALIDSLGERDKELAGLKRALTDYEAQNASLRKTLSAVTSSRSWRITEPFRQAGQFAGRSVRSSLERTRQLRSLAEKTSRAYAVLGFAGASRKVIAGLKGVLRNDTIRPVQYSASEGEDRFGHIDHDPMVSVLAVNFNGALDLPAFLESLGAQTYRNFEIVIVDNGSVDRSEQIVDRHRTLFSRPIKFIKSGRNVGFADGNNIARDHAEGELLALLNVDTRVHDDWLKEMVDALRADGSAAIAAPKVLFWTRFHDLEISTDQKVSLDLAALERTLSYKKFFVRSGTVRSGAVESDDRGKVIISLPVQDEPVMVRLRPMTGAANNVVIRSRSKLFFRAALPGETGFPVDFSLNSVGSAGFIINNAGSIADSRGMPCDRGFGEYDRGQYDGQCYVPYFCGGAALIRRAAIINRPVFVSEFFAYYEDSELSRWIASAGFRIAYAPRAIVFHKHSATLSEGSSAWRYLVERSRSIFAYTGSPAILEKELAAARAAYVGTVPVELAATLADLDKRLIGRLAAGDQLVTQRKAIGIYNSFWNTRGGGESHALSIASDLQRFGQIDLISESDFDINILASYFSLDLSRCRKLVISGFDTAWTGAFHLFINSTFCSSMPSRAPFSWYIVSFPHREIPETMRDSYFFLFNSEYTKRWALRWWGKEIRGEVLYPIRMLGSNGPFFPEQKKKIILSVGRFYPFDHSKNQLEIAKAYRALAQTTAAAAEWKLVLAGSLDYRHKTHVDYFDGVRSCLAGLNAELLPNLDRNSLDRLFSEATVYVHATGMGQDQELQPEKFEHFGITVVEAIQHGCIPVVFDIGGPAELVKQLGVGHCFSSPDSLRTSLQGLVARDLSTLTSECAVVHRRGTEFVQAEQAKPLRTGMLEPPGAGNDSIIPQEVEKNAYVL